MSDSLAKIRGMIDDDTSTRIQASRIATTRAKKDGWVTGSWTAVDHQRWNPELHHAPAALESLGQHELLGALPEPRDHANPATFPLSSSHFTSPTLPWFFRVQVYTAQFHEACSKSSCVPMLSLRSSPFLSVGGNPPMR